MIQLHWLQWDKRESKTTAELCVIKRIKLYSSVDLNDTHKALLLHNFTVTSQYKQNPIYEQFLKQIDTFEYIFFYI